MISNSHVPTLLSLVVPAFNEADNIVPLYEAVTEAFGGKDFDWEVILVDDHSSDRTPHVIGGIAKNDHRVRGVRLSRNMGSHVAMRCGVSLARGDLIGIIAADLQDQPNIIVEMVTELRRTGANVVWAAREQREGTSLADRLFSWFFHAMMSRIMERTDMPLMGADVVLFDRRVAEALHGLRETNANMFALIQWAGFRQSYLSYVKRPRRHGTSGWSFRRKMKLVIDSIVGFSYAPIRAMSLLGIITAAAAFVYGIGVLVNYFLGAPVEGWTSLMIVVLFVGGINLVAMGVLGEYVWRALDEIRGRTLFLIEAEFGALPAGASVPAPSDPGTDGMLGLVAEASGTGSGEPSSQSTRRRR
jgi:glycosyltransferase involved in cell wall biosynthesis